MSRPLARSALKLLSFSLLISINISAESKGFIFLEKYLSQIEVVSSFEDRKTGLMYRKSLPDDSGMIFAWDRKKIQCMWMKNTSIPLTVLFIDERGYVLEMQDMFPNTETPHCSANKVRFALELDTKWLKSTNITLKSRITNLDSVDD